jgi:amino acid adenylation domain-containing protein
MEQDRKILARRSNLSPAKRALLEKRLRGEVKLDSPLKVIPRRSSSDSLPLSFAQQRLWFLHQLESDIPSYNEGGDVQLIGSLNVVALEQSINEVVRRHESLRTTFEMVEGQPVQVIAPVLSLTLPVVNLHELSKADQKTEVQRLATELSQRPFDLVQEPLLRWTLLQIGEQEYVLLFHIHHIVFDGWSWDIVIRELVALYDAFSTGKPSPLPELPIQYADFALWQRQWLQGAVLETQLAYWRTQLGNHPPVLQLPTDLPRPVVQTFRGASKSFSLRSEISEALKALSRHEDVTLFMILLAAFKILIYRYTGMEDIAVGSPIANRSREEIERLIGFFVNTLVLRTDLSGNPTFRELLKRVREVTLGAYAHQDLPFEQLVEELRPQRNLSYTPLFQVMFVLQNAPQSALELPGLTLNVLERNRGTANFDLTLYMHETEGSLSGTVEYNTDLFNETTIARLVSHLQTLLAGIVANPEQRLMELPLLTADEQQRLLVEWNDTETEYPCDKCIHQLFEAQAERTPDRVAVVFEGQQLTYQELNRRANQLAHYLKMIGVGLEVLVGICMERSIEMVIGLLGVLKAGGTYVPLDSAYPQERLAFILDDTQLPVLLTQQRLVQALPQHKAKIVCLDTDWERLAQESQENLVGAATTNNLAYVIYTSGSTGKPKGVAIEHHCTIALLNWAQKLFAQEDLAGVLASTSICFDLSVFELFVPLIWGGKAILVESALHLPTLHTAQEVTLINTVPSAIAELLTTDSVPASVCTVNLAGEPLQNALAQRIYQRNTVQKVFNLYGPSEDTTYTTFTWVKKGAKQLPPIGKPIANKQIYLLDEHLQPVPTGVPAQLYIAGDGLARSYLNRPELTAEKFIPNPFGDKPGTRLYKTGDLARYRADGNIEFLGRIDRQVKIRGFRIELGEIEAVLSQHPAVRETVVTAIEDESDNKRLIAYAVPLQNPLTINELRRFLEDKLPNYMVPTAFVILDKLPLTPNGKIDRRSLPIPEALRPELEVAYVMPRTEIERTIATVWQQALKVEKIGIHDNFFELGGHSLLMVKVNSQLRELFKTDLSMLDMFRYPTISFLAEYLGQVQNQTSFASETDIQIEKLEAGKAQQRKRLQKMKAMGNM